MIVYKIENKINSKIYIGQTKKELNQRFFEHSKSKSLIGRAINKYGIQSFNVSIIDEAESRETLNEKEKYWIGYYDCINPKGYNLTIGGNGVNGYKHSEESKEKNRQNHLGKTASKETKEKMKGRIPWNKGLKGFLKGRIVWNKNKTGVKTSSKGQIPWNKGLTKETDERIASYSESLKNSTSDKVFKKGQVPWNIGVPTIHSEESNLKRSNTMIGKKKPIETVKNMKIAQQKRRAKEI